nr:NAD(P)-dependent oxidoreductase [Lachnospiraceae bacterium]
MAKRIAFIGFGEAAFYFSSGFREDGVDVHIEAYDPIAQDPANVRSSLLRDRAEKLSVDLKKNIRDVSGAEIIFCAVPSTAVEKAANQIMESLGDKTIFIDITSSLPQVKRSLGGRFAANGKLYVDASVMGAAPLLKHKTPFVLSGNGAKQAAAVLGTLHMNVQYVGEEPGRAATLKLLRSIYTKGVEALALETFLSARKLGLEKEIMQSLHRTYEVQGFETTVGQLLRSNTLHSGRRAVEAQECCDLIRETGYEPVMMEAVRNKLQWMAGRWNNSRSDSPETLEELYELWDRLNI